MCHLFHRSTHLMGSKDGQAGGRVLSVWFCRKLIMVRLTVCSSRSGPAGRRPSQASRPWRVTTPPQGPQGVRHTRQSHLQTTLWRPEWKLLSSRAPGVEPGHRHASRGRPNGRPHLWARGGGATHKNSSGCPWDACTCPNFCLQKSLLKKNLATVFAKSKHSC